MLISRARAAIASADGYSRLKDWILAKFLFDTRDIVVPGQIARMGLEAESLFVCAKR